jgi:hypothetical protein
LVNTTFDAAEVKKLVTGFTGDYQGFQAYLEGFQVSALQVPNDN